VRACGARVHARSLHPTQGMPALAAALRVASEATLGRARIFTCWTAV
jgi:hypothetical protein